MKSNNWVSPYAHNCYNFVDPDDKQDNSYHDCQSTNNIKKSQYGTKVKQNKTLGKQLSLFDF